MHDEGADDGIDTIEKFKALSGPKINDGYCTYVARAANDLYDVEDQHISSHEIMNGSPAIKELKSEGITPREHSWFEYNGRFYDYEAKNGVEHIHLLPFFQRLKSVKENKESGVAVDFDKTVHSYTSGYQKHKFDDPIDGVQWCQWVHVDIIGS